MLGWHRHKLGSVHQVTDDTATGEGATAFGLAAGTTLSASAPSGRHGSIAVAAPPCDQLGAGVAVLTGPGVTDPQPCPTDAFADVTTKPGTWTMTGPAAGLSGRSTRLLVLDL
jgi:hypothetical protein